jgi:hypothetical protein
MHTYRYSVGLTLVGRHAEVHHKALADRHAQVQQEALVSRQVQVHHKALVDRHAQEQQQAFYRQTRPVQLKGLVGRHVTPGAAQNLL